MKIIKSYGIILIKNNNVLMMNRKNSIYYIEFLMGKYKLGTLNHLELIFNRITDLEKYNILHKNFIDLWIDLWGEQYKDKHITNFNRGYKKYMILKKNSLLLYRLCNIKQYSETEWEFPKGRRELNEINIDCAIREFHEETLISIDDYDLVDNISPIIEEYISTDNVKYRICYYLAYYKKDNISDNNISNNETNITKWININNCINYIRPYHHQSKLKILNIINSIMNSYNKEYYILNNI
jgi:ADP-ribose pyrophosphatase YjhB (NUDIX family)